MRRPPLATPSVVAGPCNDRNRPHADLQIPVSRGPRPQRGAVHEMALGYSTLRSPAAGSMIPSTPGKLHPRGADPPRYVRLVSPPTSPLAGPTRDPRGAVARPSLNPRWAAALALNQR